MPYEKIGTMQAFPGGPGYGGFTKITDEQGMLPQHLQLQYDPAALNALRSRALSDNLSPYGSMALQNQAMQQASARSGLAKQINPALRGLARGQQRFAGAVNAPAQFEKDRLALVQGERDKQMALLTQMPQLENLALQPQQFNIANALTERQAQEKAKLASYQEQMKVLGGQATSAGIASGGKK